MLVIMNHLDSLFSWIIFTLVVTLLLLKKKVPLLILGCELTKSKFSLLLNHGVFEILTYLRKDLNNSKDGLRARV